MYEILGLRDSQLSMLFLQAIDINYKDIPRFRDCYPSKDGKTIIVYTRSGGDNREAYAEQIEKMQSYPNYVKDYDDSFDSTYMSFEFKPCKAYIEELQQLVKERPELARTGAEKFEKLFAQIDAVGDKQ